MNFKLQTAESYVVDQQDTILKCAKDASHSQWAKDYRKAVASKVFLIHLQNY